MQHPALAIRNSIRRVLGSSVLGKAVLEIFRRPVPTKIALVAATRMKESEFWSKASLGRSLKNYTDPLGNLSIQIYFENKTGLPTLYNQHISNTNHDCILLFVHDDVWFDPAVIFPELRKALRQYDIVGVAGSTRLLPSQPGWCFQFSQSGQLVMDHGYLSGSVAHGVAHAYSTSTYGPTPRKCAVLDGVFLAASSRKLKLAKAFFDERFKFHFYDLDFCRNATQSGLIAGTWPLFLIHESGGAFGTPTWNAAYQDYLSKWNQ